MKFTVTLAVVSLLGQVHSRADGWTTTDRIVKSDTYDAVLTLFGGEYQDDFVKKSEYSSEVEDYGVINWMNYCYDQNFGKTKLEWSYHNICDSQDGLTTNPQITLNNNDKYEIGATNHTFSASECDNIDRLEPGECITEASIYVSYGTPYAMIYSTNQGLEDVFFMAPINLDSRTKATYTPSFLRQIVADDSNSEIIDANMTTSTTQANDQQVCLTALELQQVIYGGFGFTSDYKVSYNPDSWQYDSSHCESHRNPGAAGGAIAGAVIGVCCFGGIVLAIWFFFFRRTGSAGSLTADNQKPSTPEAAPQQTTTTTVIQQQPAMMMQPQPMMMQQQPMMMGQQPGMMPMNQPGMMPMQQPGMVQMQQPGMMQMQQPGMQQQVVYQ